MSIIVKLFSKQLGTLKKLDPTEVTISPWAITRGLLGREKWAYHQSSECFFDDFFFGISCLKGRVTLDFCEVHPKKDDLGYVYYYYYISLLLCCFLLFLGFYY